MSINPREKQPNLPLLCFVARDVSAAGINNVPAGGQHAGSLLLSADVFVSLTLVGFAGLSFILQNRMVFSAPDVRLGQGLGQVAAYWWAMC